MPPLPPFQAPAGALRSARLLVTEDSVIAGHPASRTVTRLARQDGRRRWQTNVGCEPATIVMGESRLFVACSNTPDIVVLDKADGAVLDRRAVGRNPFGIVAVSGRLIVSLQHEQSVVVLRADTLVEIARARVRREPRGLAVAADRLYVAHLLDASVRVLSLPSLARVADVSLGAAAVFAEGVTVDPEAGRAYVAHQRQNVTNVARLFDSTIFPMVSVIDTSSLQPVRAERLSLDTVDRPVSMPIAALSAGGRLFVANAASDDLTVVDLAAGRGVGHVDLGHHPRDLAVSPDGRLIYALNLVSDDISVVSADGLEAIATFPLAEDPRPPVIQRGERLFFTSEPDTISQDNWMACASCHFDAGLDAQTWLGTEGGARNTTTLRGIRDTEPLHWSADREDVQAFQETFEGLMAGTGLGDPELDALADFLRSLDPLASPLRASDGSLTDEARQGARIFQRAGCSLCHAPPAFTDRQLHDVGTGDPYQDSPAGGKVPETLGAAYDTPSLRELWLTPPYLHDGRAETLRDVLTTHNPDGRHGSTAGLSDEELSALEAFLLQLPLTPEEATDFLTE